MYIYTSINTSINDHIYAAGLNSLYAVHVKKKKKKTRAPPHICRAKNSHLPCQNA